MNQQKFSAIAHRDHDYCNPISATKIERLLDLLPLDETSRALDLGCGRAELALRIIERFGSPVIAVEHSSLMLDAALTLTPVQHHPDAADAGQLALEVLIEVGLALAHDEQQADPGERP